MVDKGLLKWTVIVLTCQHRESVYAFQRELEGRQKRGALPADALLLTVPDPHTRLGSGGATLNALLVAAEHLSARAGYSVVNADVLDEAHVLILHTGRDFPWDGCSRAFCWMPVQKSDAVEGAVCCLDLLLDCLSTKICAGSPPGVWVCSTDVILNIPTPQLISWDGFSGVRVVALPGDVSFAVNHGVYLTDAEAGVCNIIYKGSKEKISCAALPDGKVPLVSGPVFFSRTVAEKLLQTHVTSPLDGCTYLGMDSGAPPLEVSLFLDILLCLCSDLTEHEFINGERTGCSSPSGPQGAVVRSGRAVLWRTLRGPSISMPQYLWGPERTEPCCLLDARLFPVFMPHSGPVGLEGVCWLLGGAGGLDSWREAWRLSLRDILILTDQQRELRWREELFFSVGRRRAVDTLQGHMNLSLQPFFRAAALSGQQEELLQVLDSVAAGSSGDLGVAARCLACIADVLGCLAGEGKGGLRSGPAANPSWAPAFKLLEGGNLPAGVQELANQRKHWLSRPDLLVRAARHYEGAGQILLRKAVMSAREFVFIGQGEMPPMGEWQEVECPARLDLSGGWSDTPPIAFEHGGLVVNVAIKVDGKRPIGARVRRVPEPRLLLVSSSGEPACSISTETLCEDLTDLEDYYQPHAPGTSSILAGAALAAVYRCTGRSYDTNSLIHDVLYLEQILTTGGGWQDQVGGLFGGVKLARSAAQLPLRVEVEQLSLTQDFLSVLQQHLLLVYTGKTRLARNLLQDVVRSWYARLPSIVQNAEQLVTNAEECAEACRDGSLLRLGECMNTYWQQKKLMAPGCEPAAVRSMMNALQPLSLGQSLAGAGGGGFLFLLTREPQQKEAVREILTNIQGIGSFSVHSVELDMDGISIIQKSSEQQQMT
ncbi:hypothetical protein cypCar_00026094 [Cyprinus carpio]|nr:hypothetical protein cypCar_00026094 [Cyprinus carpio]